MSHPFLEQFSRDTLCKAATQTFPALVEAFNESPCRPCLVWTLIHLETGAEVEESWGVMGEVGSPHFHDMLTVFRPEIAKFLLLNNNWVHKLPLEEKALVRDMLSLMQLSDSGALSDPERVRELLEPYVSE